jgi:hypothetical protein
MAASNPSQSLDHRARAFISAPTPSMALLRSICSLMLCTLAAPALAGEVTASLDQATRDFPTASDPYNTVINPTFNFRLDLPAGWRAINKSANGDGYFLDVGNPAVDARAYGSYWDSLSDRPHRTPFKFADGKTGWRANALGHVTYARAEGDRFLFLYVEAPASWLNQNAGTVDRVAKSLRPGAATP